MFGLLIFDFNFLLFPAIESFLKSFELSDSLHSIPKMFTHFHHEGIICPAARNNTMSDSVVSLKLFLLFLGFNTQVSDFLFGFL